MPIPTPSDSEISAGRSGKNKFIGRCIRAIIDEYGMKIARGICYSQWDEATGKSKSE